jgi:hypothetical protein
LSILNLQPMQKALFFILLILFTINGFAQYKYEREIRAREKDVPTNALQFVESLDFTRKIRWYKEIGINRVSYEAKTRYNGEKYSIKFSEDGTFEDMEIEMPYKDIPDEAHKPIEEFLLSEFGSYSIEKVQIQFTGNAELIRTNFRDGAGMPAIDIHYEIVISAKLDGSYSLFEYLFSKTGGFVHKARIIEKSINNIIY